MTAPALDIVIVSFNVRVELDACLRSLRNAPPRAAHRVTVVDNQSSDDTVAWLKAHWPDVEVIAAATNLGFAGANNVGIRATSAPLVLLLNPDTIVTPGALDLLVDALAHHPEAAAAGPRLIGPDGREELSFGWPMSPWGELMQKVVGSLYARNAQPFASAVRYWTRVPGPRRWLSGACLLLRRADLEAVGLLDEQFFMYAEDVDLCVRLRRRGRALLFVPGAAVRHLRGRSSSASAARRHYRRASQLAFYRKHHPRWVRPLGWYLRASSSATVPGSTPESTSRSHP